VKIAKFWKFLMPIGLVVHVSAATASDIGVRRYELPDHGAIEFRIPTEWKDHVNQPPRRLPPTIVLEAKGGAPFQVLITPIWPARKDAPPSSAASLREIVQGSIERAKSQAVEKEITIRELDHAPGPGFYFSATDRAPNPGEYSQLTQGMLRLEDLSIAFTILTNSGQERIVADALKILRSAVRAAQL